MCLRDSATTVQIRRAALKDQNRTFGYPSIVNVGALAAGDPTMQAALVSLFTVKYGSIIVMEGMDYAQALPLYGLRQNVFTDPQKPMKVEPGIYPLDVYKRQVCEYDCDGVPTVKLPEDSPVRKALYSIIDQLDLS